jgi:hypothetical protein
MSLVRLAWVVSGVCLRRPKSFSCSLAQTSSKKPAMQFHAPHASPKLHRLKQRRLRCDCGRLAITVRLVRVGSDPQYTIRLPLCPACLKLEQELHGYH